MDFDSWSRIDGWLSASRIMFSFQLHHSSCLPDTLFHVRLILLAVAGYFSRWNHPVCSTASHINVIMSMSAVKISMLGKVHYHDFGTRIHTCIIVLGIRDGRSESCSRNLPD